MLEATSRWLTPPEAVVTSVRLEMVEPVKTLTVGTNELPVVPILIRPFEAAVHFHQREAPPPLKEGSGSKGSLLAFPLDAVTVTEGPTSSVAFEKLSFVGGEGRALASDSPKVEPASIDTIFESP